ELLLDNVGLCKRKQRLARSNIDLHPFLQRIRDCRVAGGFWRIGKKRLWVEAGMGDDVVVDLADNCFNRIHFQKGLAGYAVRKQRQSSIEEEMEEREIDGV